MNVLDPTDFYEIGIKHYFSLLLVKQIKYFLKNWIVRIVSFFFHREKLLHTQLSLVCCLSFNQMWFSVYLVLIFHNNYVHVGFVNICICTAFYLFHSFYKTTILFFCLEILASAKVKFIWQSKSFNIQLTLSFIIVTLDEKNLGK